MHLFALVPRQVACVAVLSTLGLVVVGATPSRAQQADPVTTQPGKLAVPEAQSALSVDARLGTGVEERELVGEGTDFHVGQKAFLWMRLTGGPADPVTVTWRVGEHSYDVTLNVGGSSWRTWSSKALWTAGDWSVEVSDAEGVSLFTTSFSVDKATSALVEDTADGQPR